jgi:hypothetical protein
MATHQTTSRTSKRNAIVWLGLVTLLTALFVAACSKSGGNDLHVKSPAAGDKDVPVKSSYTFAVTKSFTDINQKITTAATYNVYAANYDLDAGNFAMTLQKPLAGEDQIRVEFSLVGEEGTNDKSALKTGTYSAKADKYMKVETVGVVARRGSTDTRYLLDRSTLTGEVKLTSVSDDSISGDIDVTAGESAVKGSFTAKILKRK